MQAKKSMVHTQSSNPTDQQAAMLSSNINAMATGTTASSSNMHEHDASEMSDQELLEIALMMEKCRK